MDKKETILLHSDVFMPSVIKVRAKQILSDYRDYSLTRHVLEHATLDENFSHNYTKEGLERVLKEQLQYHFYDNEIFEVELTKQDKHAWFISKICVRVPYNYRQDICLAIRPHRYKEHTASIITAWLNDSCDYHYSLDKSKYVDKEHLAINVINDSCYDKLFLYYIK